MEPIARGHTLMVHRKPPRARARHCRANLSRSACHLPPWIPGDGRHPAQPPHASLRKNIESHTHILGSFPCLVKTQRFQLAVSQRPPILSAVRPHPPAQPRRVRAATDVWASVACATGGGRGLGYHQCPVTVTASHTPRVAPSAPAGLRHLDAQAVSAVRLPPPPSPAPWAGGLPSPRLRRTGVSGGGPDARMTPEPRTPPREAREAPSAAALARGSCVSPPRPSCL